VLIVRLSLFLAAAAALAWPAASLADGPVIDRYEVVSDEVFDGCGFPVRIQIEGKAIDHVFLDDDGQVTRLLLNGPFKAVLTNLTTGKALASINISGSLDTRFNEDGSRSATIRGPWILLYRPESLEPLPIVPWLFLFQGTRVLTIDASGTRRVTWRGRFVDLCAELAG
jgi:hypothetical protein